ncbi:MAG: hypothetical protein JWO94_2730 [Verrucomicrobiaceae bacterium]|nr:hypothetical protein [Verrucomicrobiaceae bacterium]
MKNFFRLSLLLITAAIFAGPPTPPSQPAAGPGGKACPHAAVRKLGPFGEGGRAFWLYEPDAPAPASAPVVAFLHGYTGVDAKVYGNWIEHIVKRGNVVIYPVYQTSLLRPEDYTGNALAALKAAFRLLEEPGHVHPDAAANFAFVGHSLGGPISANLAALAQEEGLPRPKAFMACHAGDTNVLKTLPPLLLPPKDIPDLLLLVVVGAADHLIGDVTGREIFFRSSGVRPENKNLILLPSDDHGRPALVSNHFAPLSLNEGYANGARLGIGLQETDLPSALRSGLTSKIRRGATMPESFGRTDALDFYGYWKWFDALTDAAFFGTHRDSALGNTTAQKCLGHWSDGRPVIPATVEQAK